MDTADPDAPVDSRWISLSDALTAVTLAPAAEHALESGDYGVLYDGAWGPETRIVYDECPPGARSLSEVSWSITTAARVSYVSVYIGNLEFRVHTQSALCELWADTTDADPDDDCGPSGWTIPEDQEITSIRVSPGCDRRSVSLGHLSVAEVAILELNEIEICEGVRDEMAFVVSTMASHYSRLLINNFKAGRHRVRARMGSILAPFQDLPRDAWQHLDVEDWKSGRLMSTSGERCFSAQVFVQYQAEVDAAQPPRLTNTAVKECERQLREIIAASPNRRTIPKAVLRETLVASIPGLTKRAFDRSWDKIIDEVGAPAWKRQGPTMGKAADKGS